MQSGGIGHNETSILELPVDASGGIEFRWKVSSEFESDYLSLTVIDVNGEEVAALSKTISGEVDWQQETVSIPATGNHTVRWSYSKDGSGSSGADAGWIDDLVLFLPSSEGPVITSPLEAEGTQGSPFSYTITILDGCPFPPTFGATGLPAGLSVDPDTGAISGIPNEDGLFNVSISATDGCDGTSIKNLVLTILTEDQVENISDSGSGSLRQLIINADLGDTLSVDASLNGQTIELAGSRLLIDKDLTIDASSLSKGLTVSANDLSRVFFITGNSTVTLKGLTVSNGYVGTGFGGGGGIAVNSGSHLELIGVTLKNNESAERGGAIANYGSMNISGSTLSFNHAAESGGGIYTENSLVTIENSTISDNTSGTSSGAGIRNQGTASALTLRHVTVAGNTGNTVANNYTGAGVLNWTGATLTLENTLIGENFTGTGSVSNLEGDVSSLGANVVVSHNGTLLSGSPFISDSPLLSALGNYGGLTATRIPLLGSPAREAAVSLGTTPAFDQRGASRPYGPQPDIGAVEVLPLADALDITEFDWATGGDAVWYGQTDVSNDSVDAARSAASRHDETSTLETTISDPGTLTFVWKVSSEPGYDFLRFFLNGVEQPGIPGISGEVGWQPVSVPIPAGVNNVRWTYSKDFSISTGADAGWLDEVVFVPAAPVITSALTALGTEGTPFSYTITAT